MKYWHQKLVDWKTILRPSNRPDVVDQRANGPVSGLSQENKRRPHPEFPLAGVVAGGCRKLEDGTESPDQCAGFGRGKENEGTISPKPKKPTSFCVGTGCEITGVIQRTIRFQSSFSPIGITG
jgi:hypothetical protein